MSKKNIHDHFWLIAVEIQRQNTDIVFNVALLKFTRGRVSEAARVLSVEQKSQFGRCIACQRKKSTDGELFVDRPALLFRIPEISKIPNPQVIRHDTSNQYASLQ